MPTEAIQDQHGMRGTLEGGATSLHRQNDVGRPASTRDIQRKVRAWRGGARVATSALAWGQHIALGIGAGQAPRVCKLELMSLPTHCHGL